MPRKPQSRSNRARTLVPEPDNTVVYIYHGDGTGIPGMPHRLTLKRAAELNLTAQLQTAIDADIYRIDHDFNPFSEEDNEEVG